MLEAVATDYMDFNPRTREGCDRELYATYTITSSDFNPRTREGCDIICVYLQAVHIEISIHAPVKGATHRAVKKMSRSLLFQSTHP